MNKREILEKWFALQRNTIEKNDENREFEGYLDIDLEGMYALVLFHGINNIDHKIKEYIRKGNIIMKMQEARESSYELSNFSKHVNAFINQINEKYELLKNESVKKL